MFSFHKPRVYRSTEGCCICRAKSSSSRFTDSKKYEDDSMKCFNLEKPRQGEICNACVLLVKRFKRLPVGSNRHWGHVVDARIGPGMKSISKFKKLKEECQQQQRQLADNKPIGSKLFSVSEKFCKIFRKNKKKRLTEKNFRVKEDDNSSDENSSPGTPESLNSDDEGIYRSRRRRLSGIKRRKNKKPMKLSKKKLESVGFFDENEWVSRWSCCGVIYENSKIGALLVDYEKCKPCPEHLSFFKSALLNSSHKVAADAFANNMNSSAFPVAHGSQLSVLQKTTMISNSNGNLPTMNIESLVASATTAINKNHFALKKHQIYFRRQSENFPENECSSTKNNENNSKNEIMVVNSQLSHHSEQGVKAPTNVSKIKHTFLHKIKSDTVKIIKNSMDKVSNLSKIKPIEMVDGKDVKIISTSAPTVRPANVPQPTDGNSATKFSDNSSDSGFDENLPEPATSNIACKDGKDRTVAIQPINALFISSAVPITIPNPPVLQKAPMRAHKTIHAPSIALLGNSKVRTIYNGTADVRGLSCVALPQSVTPNVTNPTLLNVSAPATAGTTITHKKFLYVKGKQNVDVSNN